MPPRCRLRNHRFRTDLLTRTSSTWRRFPRRIPAAIIHCRSVSLLTATACSFAKYPQPSVGPKSPSFAFTSFSTLARRLSAKRRFDARPRSRCTIPPSLFFHPYQQIPHPAVRYPQMLRRRPLREMSLLFAHPAILPVFNRNFLLCWNRNFSFFCDTDFLPS
jgi:hypothetical protein